MQVETTLYQKLKGWHYRPGKDLTLIMRLDGEDAHVSTFRVGGGGGGAWRHEGVPRGGRTPT